MAAKVLKNHLKNQNIPAENETNSNCSVKVTMMFFPFLLTQFSSAIGGVGYDFRKTILETEYSDKKWF